MPIAHINSKINLMIQETSRRQPTMNCAWKHAVFAPDVVRLVLGSVSESIDVISRVSPSMCL